jgi:hypothetical protein
MWNTLPTYAQVKEFWTGYNNQVQQFFKDWAKDVQNTFKKQD